MYILIVVLNPCYKFDFFEGMDFGKELIETYKKEFKAHYLEYAKWFLEEQDKLIPKSPPKRQTEGNSSMPKKTVLDWSKIKSKNKSVSSPETLDQRAEGLANTELHNYLEGCFNFLLFRDSCWHF